MSNKNNERVGAKSKRILTLVLSMLIAVALCVTCILFFNSSKTVPTDNDSNISVDQSATYTDRTGNLTAGGAIVNGDILNYTYNGSYRSVTLPKGTYTLEVWGAAGGGTGSDAGGGLGGYAKGTLVVAGNTTYYIYIGGKGANSTSNIDGNADSTAYAGGYNGGGNGSGRGGPGGGGGTDIRSGSTSTSSRIIVAAGGGGGITRSNGNTSRSNGVLFNGTAGCRSRHRSSYSNDEGGGGGGYYGGQSTHGDDARQGYAGTNYTGSLSSATNSYGQRAGNGYARITVVQVNQVPVTKNATIAGGARGTCSIAINASAIASDPEGTAVYFSNGTSSNYDTYTSAGLWLNSACTTSASNYLNWSYTNSGTITVTSIKRYPRSGVDGCTSNGRLTLYTRVRDNFGTNTQRGVSVIVFYLTVTETAPTKRDTVTLNGTDGNEFNDIFLGTSKTATQPSVYSVNNIFNPKGTGRYTAQISHPLRIYNASKNNLDEVKVTLKASDLFTGVNTYDNAIIVVNDVSGINKNDPTRLLQITEYDNNQSVTAYNASGTRLANAFNQLTFVGINSDKSFQVLPVTLYIAEKTATNGTNYQLPYVPAISLEIVFKVDNTRPTLKSGVNWAEVDLNVLQSKTISLDTYFTDADNTTITTNSHRIIDVKVPTNEYVQLTQYGEVVPFAGGASAAAYNVFSTGVRTPSASDLTAAATSGELGAQPTGFLNEYISTSASNSAFVQYSYNGINLTFTGLRATYNLYSGRRMQNAETYKSLTAGDSTTGGTSSISKTDAGHFYILVKVRDTNDPDDNGIWLPIALKVNNTAPTETSIERGQTGATVMPTADGAVGATYYFSPMGITVDRVTTPLGSYKNDQGTLISTGLQALASDSDNFYSATMLNGGKLNELLQIGSSVSSIMASVGQNASGEYFTVEEENIYINKTYFYSSNASAARVRLNGTIVDSGTPLATENISGVEYVIVKGLKLTLNSWTHNRFLYASVVIKDSANATATARIAVKVSNTTPNDADKIATLNYDYNGIKISSAYDNSSIPTITYRVPMYSKVIITPYDLLNDYNMKRSGVQYPAQGFTLNGLTGGFSSNMLTAGAGAPGTAFNGIANSSNTAFDYSSSAYRASLKSTLSQLNVSRSLGNVVAQTNNFAAATAGNNIGIDRLYFERSDDSVNLDGYTFNPVTADFAQPVTNNGTYVNTEFGNRVYIDGATYYIDFLMISALSRTPGDTCTEITLNVRDRTGAGAAGSSSGVSQIKVKIFVTNATPSLKDPNKSYTLSVAPISDSTVTNTVLELNVGDILTDNEQDAMSFYNTSDRTFAVKDGAGNTVDANGNSYYDKYLSVSMTASKMTVTALNSTQMVSTGLYVHFYATDGRDATVFSTLQIRFEVINSRMSINYQADGFTKIENSTTDAGVWTIDSVSAADFTTARYFASPGGAEYLLGSGYASSQVKKLVNDADNLQSAILAPVKDLRETNKTYLNYNSIDGLTAYSDYVPYIYQASNDLITSEHKTDSPTAVWYEWTAMTQLDFEDYITSIDIEYYVDLGDGSGVQAFSATSLRGANKDIVNNNHTKFFDDNGRWAVEDWAVVVTPKAAFATGVDFRLNITMRDDSRYGGDTAGLTTAYLGERNAGANAVIDGYYYGMFDLFIKDAGIVTLDYYDNYNGYYTVIDGADSSVAYVSTYDGNTDSQYPAGIENIYYNSSTGVISTGTAAPSGSTLVKERLEGHPDGSLIGVNSGVQYNSNLSADDLSGAFRYTKTIDVAGSNSATYIPMSYFALRPSLTTANAADQSVVYPANDYIAYDVNQLAYDRGSISDINSAISVSDGKSVWTGSNLNDNGYIKFSAYDAYRGGALDTANQDYNKSLNSPYFNNRLAITTVTKSGATAIANEYIKNAQNKNQLIGNGHAMYLAEQAQKLQEHMFGLSIEKGTKRGNSSNLTITIKVALCTYNNDQNGTKVNYDPDNSDDKDKYTGTIVLNVRIGNAPMTLSGDSITQSATNGYYTDVELSSSDSSYNIALSNTSTNYDKTIAFNDADSEDVANFSSDSLRKLSAWNASVDYGRITTLRNETNLSAAALFTNTASNDVAQASMRNYFTGGAKGNTTPSAVTAGRVSSITSSYLANDGMYGSDNEKYSNYFNVVVGDGGKSLQITPIAKTTINTAICTSTNRQTIEEFYAARGLVPEFLSPSSTVVKRAYYPLKVIVYDTCGDGWSEASYVCLEIRVYINNSAPKLAIGVGAAGENNRQLNISLAVGSAYQFNLQSAITDSDMLTGSSGGYMFKDEYDKLVADYSSASDTDKFRAESGDYIVSPLTTYQSYSTVAAANDDLRKGVAGFWDSNIKDQPDLVMYMETPINTSVSNSTIPISGTIHIMVNRRTSYIDENNISRKQNEFDYVLTFSDSAGNSTGKLTVHVNVTNQTPRVHTQNIVSSVKMRVGDSFTVLTTPYEYFFDGTATALASSSNRNYAQSTSQNVALGTIGYDKLTTEGLGSSEYKLTDYKLTDAANKHLGYMALANDDTAWALRILSVSFYNGAAFSYTSHNLLQDEGTNTGTRRATNVVVTALNVCSNMPVTYTVTDTEGGIITYTMYITVESSSPLAITADDIDIHPLNPGLAFTDETGVYSLYMTTDESAENGKQIELHSDDPNNVETVTAYSQLKVAVNRVAYDTDYNDNINMGLYVSPNGNFPLFSESDVALEANDGFVYSNNKFRITVDSDYASFTIQCISFDVSSDYNYLTFYVKDTGDNTLEKALRITLKITTLYSSVTNTHAATNTQNVGSAVIVSKADTVYVTGYDDYVGVNDSPDTGVQSTYQFLNYYGVADSVGQESASIAYINDPDVANSRANLAYDVRLYAFINSENSNFASMGLRDVSSLLTINKSSGVFKLTDKFSDNVGKYLVGGVDSSGSPYTGNVNDALLSFVRQYFTFSFGNDGVSILFRPVTANINTDILFYVEAQKNTGSSRNIRPADSMPVAAGSLFYVKVRDSAPVSNVDDAEMTFVGGKGDSKEFVIFDNADPYRAMFTDSDLNDYVVVDGFNPSDTTDKDYTAALNGVKYDWKSGKGKDRAITIAIDNNTHKLKLTINRRIDALDDNGNYLSQVTLPVKITGKDVLGETATVTIYVTICNTDFTIKEDKLIEKINSNGIGYKFTRGDESYLYNLDTFVSRDYTGLDIDTLTCIQDPDFTNVSADTDSFRFVVVEGMHENKYLAKDILNVYANDADGNATQTVIAQLTPKYTDDYHFTGFSITATSYARGYSGTAYVRILDRSGNADDVSSGVLITVSVTIVNSAPKINSGKENAEFSVVGSDTATITPITLNISDYVSDPNITDTVDKAGETNTYIRITSLQLAEPETVNATRVDESGDTSIITVNIDTDNNSLSCIITPKTGFYGSQSMYVTVSDGDYSIVDTLSVTFMIKIIVAYNFNEVGALKPIVGVRGLYTQVTAEDLIAEVQDVHGGETDDKDSRSVNGAAQSAAEDTTFNPGQDYVISRLTVPTSYVDYIAVDQNEEGVWQFKPLRLSSSGAVTVNAEFKLRTDTSDNATVFSSSFSVNINENPKPVLIKAFSDGYTFYSSGQGYTLNADGVVYLTPANLFTDNDGDIVKFISASSKAPTLVKVEVIAKDNLALTFNANGSTEITVTASDATDESVTFKFTVINLDRPDPSFWTNIKISFESNTILWIGIIAAAVALIVVLIIVIIAVKHKKRKRAELEALLVQEMEVEEQMMRLSQAPGATQYQSYGYLPPTVNVQNDPGLMIGSGTQNMVPPAGLAPGQSPTEPGATIQDPTILDDLDGF